MKTKQAKLREPKVRGRADRGNRKEQILFAAEKILYSRGLSGTTTRQIAKEAGCSEGAIYVHFKSRVELLLAVSHRSGSDMLKSIEALKDAAGRDTPQRNLEAALRGMFSFHQRIMPMIGGLLADPKLLRGYRKSLGQGSSGPSQLISGIAAYIRAEQALDRIPAGVDADLAAVMLISASFFRAFHLEFFGSAPQPSAADFPAAVTAQIAFPHQ